MRRMRNGDLGRACLRVGRRVITAKATKSAVTAAGRVALRRRLLRRSDCRTTAYPLDAGHRLEALRNSGATRRACLAAVNWPFDVAAARLGQPAAVRLEAETIRRLIHRAAALAERRNAAPTCARHTPRRRPRSR